MKNFLDDGDTIPIASMPEAADSGEFILLGALYGVAVAAYESGAAGVLKRTGVFELPKVNTAAWTQGMKLYWDASAKKFTIDSSKTPVEAIAWVAAAEADTTGIVLLGVGPGLRIVGGLHTTIDADDTVVTGLTTVLGAVANLASDPVAGAQWVTAAIGDQAGSPAAGSIQIKSWKATAAGDTAPTAGTTFSKLVGWIAFGL